MSDDFDLQDEYEPGDVEATDSDTHSGGIVHEPQPLSRQVFGTAAIYLGAFILLIAGCERFGGQLGFLPRFWYVNRTMWIGLGILLIPTGVAIQSQKTKTRATWTP